jgi:hypothetical protein
LEGNVKAQTFWLKTVGGWQETGKVAVTSEDKLIAINCGQRIYSILLGRFGGECRYLIEYGSSLLIWGGWITGEVPE